MDFSRYINRRIKNRRPWLIVVMSACFICLPLVSLVSAIDTEEQLMHAGLDLFPRFIAADLKINEKKGADGKLLLLIVYNSKAGAKCRQALTSHLKNISEIREIPVQLKVIASHSLPDYEKETVAGIYLCGRQVQHLKGIMNFAKKKHTLVFSPFPEVVKAGAHGGLTVTDRIRPLINQKALSEADIQLKSFFLRIAKQL